MKAGNKKKFLESLSAPHSAGNISYACKKTGLSRQTIYNWQNEDKEFKAEMEKCIQEGKSSIADLAEEALVKKIKEGNITAIIFTLKSLRRDYYGEFSEIPKDETNEYENFPLGKPKNEKEEKILEFLITSHNYYEASKSKLFNKQDKANLKQLMEKAKSAVNGNRAVN